VLAIDLGTSGAKAAVVSLPGQILGAGRVPVETIHLPDDGAGRTRGGLDSGAEGVARPWVAGRAAPDVCAICMSQYSSVVPVGADGRPVMNMIPWLTGAALRPDGAAWRGSRRDSPLRLLSGCASTACRRSHGITLHPLHQVRTA
jgi:xylulokinase